jgi:hypothetical protein
MENAVLTSFGGNLAAMALAGGLYFGFRLLRRMKCASHTGCCDIELSKAETMRDDRMLFRIIEGMRKDNGAPALQVDDARPQTRRPGDEGFEV